MEKVSSIDIAEWMGAEVKGELGAQTRDVEVSTDSRTISSGELFFAIKGPKFDGHFFVEEALAKGAIAAVVCRSWCRKEGSGVSGPLLVVEDTLKALGELANKYRKRFSPTILAITGTNGKTTTKEMIANLFSNHYPTLRSEKSFNNLIGLPITLLHLSAQHRMAVVEMGTSSPGEIRALSQICLPKMGLITNIGPAHLENLVSLRQVAQAKLELLEALPSTGIGFLNADDPYLRFQSILPSERVVTFGVKRNSDFWANKVKKGEGGIEFDVRGQTFRLNLLGLHNLYNALAAISVGRTLGLEWEDMKITLDSYRPPPMRMEKTKISGISIINDAYNANPESVKSSLTALEEEKGRRIAVLGDMLELGEKSSEYHIEVGKYLAGLDIDLLVTVGKEAQKIIEGATKRGYPQKWSCDLATNREAIEYLQDTLIYGDVVLVKGSRRMRMEEIVEGIKEFLTIYQK